MGREYFTYILTMLHLYFRSLNSGNFSSNFCVCYMAQKTQSSYTVYIVIFYFYFVLLNYYAIGIHLQYILFLARKIMRYLDVSYMQFFTYLCINNIHLTLQGIYTDADLKIWYYFHPYKKITEGMTL